MSFNQRPTFFWQALLIVLPVALLATVGFLSLRQDKLLAQSEAAERAQAIAEQLLPQVWVALTEDNVEEEPQRHPAFQVDSAGQLLFPPPRMGLPPPRPLSANGLSQQQARVWQDAQRAESQKNDPAAAVKCYTDFLALTPPRDFSALAHYALGLLLVQQGDTNKAAKMFDELVIGYPGAIGDTGLPLQPFAELKSLELSMSRSRSLGLRSLDLFCSNIIYYPTIVTPSFLVEASRLTQSSNHSAIDNWQRIWEQHERSRVLYATACQHFGSRALPYPKLETYGAGISEVFVGPQSPKKPWATKRKGIFDLRVDSGLTNPANTVGPRMFWFTTEETSTKLATGNDSGSRTNKATHPAAHHSELEENWLAVRHKETPTNCWFLCLLDGEARNRLSSVTERASRIPEYFGIALELAGKTFARSQRELQMWTEYHYAGKGGGWARQYSAETASDVELLGSAAHREDGNEFLKVNVYLTSPGTMFARQRARTFWFSLLIAVSALAALVGLVTAWRAFHRQLQLIQLKTNFVSSVSHELRSPVASVRLMAESLDKGKITEPAKQHEYFGFIVQECRRLSSLVENVLDFSRIEQGRKEYDFEPTDLLALTEQTVKLMEPSAAERQVRLALTALDHQLSTVDYQLSLDGKGIQQALINLIDNAIKHSPKGGTVTVGLERIECGVSSEGEQKYEVASGSPLDAPSSALVTLFVEDHGAGIPPEEHEKIFERFYRRGSELRRQTQGVGIGLSIVKHIVEAHGGQVRVRSAVGAGSRFTIELRANPNSE